MKITISILKLIIINIVLIKFFLAFFNPFELTFIEFFTRRIEYWFSPSVDYNIYLIISFIAIIIYNAEWINKLRRARK
jgi:hypothetical protein